MKGELVPHTSPKSFNWSRTRPLALHPSSMGSQNETSIKTFTITSVIRSSCTGIDVPETCTLYTVRISEKKKRKERKKMKTETLSGRSPAWVRFLPVKKQQQKPTKVWEPQGLPSITQHSAYSCGDTRCRFVAKHKLSSNVWRSGTSPVKARPHELIRGSHL